MLGSGGRIAALLGAVALAAASSAVPAPVALASSTQVSILEDDARIQADPAGTLERLHILGADVVRVAMRWQLIAPSPNSRPAPRGFDASDPAAYPASKWRLWDEIVTDARQDGITVDLDLMGGAPRWALGPGRPAGNSNPNWEPSATAFGAFVRAVGTRYSGNYDPSSGTSVPGDPNDSPGSASGRSGTSLITGRASLRRASRASSRSRTAPGCTGTSSTRLGARCRPPGHATSTDTIVFGELAPRGQKLLGRVLRDDAVGVPAGPVLRGLGLPPAPRKRRSDQGVPGDGGGLAAVPRPESGAVPGQRRLRPPLHAVVRAEPELDPDPTNGSSTADYTLARGDRQPHPGSGPPPARLRLAHALPDLRHRVRLHHESAQAQPGSRSHRTKVIYLPPATAAAYMNWAEYLSWRNPRVAVVRAVPPVRPRCDRRSSNDWGGFASGLLSWNGVQKTTYYAWRLPLYLPVTGARPGRSLEVWGCVRPAPFGVARHRARRRQPRSSSLRRPSGSTRRSRP